MDGACSTYGVKGGAYRVLMGIAKGNRTLGTFRLRWKDSIKMVFQEIRWRRGMD
jgi:hypothetical protein